MDNLKQILNEPQYKAVTQTDGSYLILAGAGSGKTRVITYKIAYLISKKINPDNILAVTFTNKAAKEMKGRVSCILNRKKIKVLITTFHSLGVKILRKEIIKLGYREKYSIYNENDSKELLKDIVHELKLMTDKYDPKILIYKISEIKNNISEKIEDKNIELIFEKYQKYLKIYNAVDFDDLILLPIQILQKYPEVLEKYQKKWKYILVDEYQDTSITQYNFIKLLAIKHKNISIVGDDDQSIYSWRGANPKNLSLFESDFYPIQEIKLEQNYRSTKNILDAANNIIKNNSIRKIKKLWTNYNNGDLIKIYEAEDENKEAEFISIMIRKYLNESYKFCDIGVLLRMNSQSRPVEEVFRENDIPYKMIGAINFFERQEIRDILSYMRFLTNHEDEISLIRIINNPKRGIGSTTLHNLMEHAKEKNSSLYSAIKDFIKTDILGNKITPYLDDFNKLIEKYREMIFKPKNIAKTVSLLIDEIGYKEKLSLEYKDKKKVIQKMNNINQLIQSISRYENNSDNFEPNVYDYLQKVSLVNDDEEDNNDSVSIMSIHSAKGLEFKIVFVVGVEEGLIPHHKTLSETGNIEEERRLFYVAVTRAKEKLFLSFPKIRIKFNETFNICKSDFINEIPDSLLEIMDMEKELDGKKSTKLLLEKWKN